MSTIESLSTSRNGCSCAGKFPFDRVLTPLTLSIALEEGKLRVVGYRSQLIPLGHTGSPAVLRDPVPEPQPSFGRI